MQFSWIVSTAVCSDWDSVAFSSNYGCNYIWCQLEWLNTRSGSPNSSDLWCFDPSWLRGDSNWWDGKLIDFFEQNGRWFELAPLIRNSTGSLNKLSQRVSVEWFWSVCKIGSNLSHPAIQGYLWHQSRWWAGWSAVSASGSSSATRVSPLSYK